MYLVLCDRRCWKTSFPNEVHFPLPRVTGACERKPHHKQDFRSAVQQTPAYIEADSLFIAAITETSGAC